MLLRVDEQDAPIDAIAIEEFEQKHAIRLPDSFKEFLLSTNGGRPYPCNFPIRGMEANPIGGIQSFYGLHATLPGYDLDVVLSEQPASVPHGVVPIAHTGYENDQLVIDLRDPGAPVKFFDSIPFWGNNIWNEAYLYPVADNFEGLLASLVTDEEAGLVV